MGTNTTKLQSRIYSQKFFPKLHDEQLTLKVFEFLLPHELYKISFLNSYIYQFINDPLVWTKLSTHPYPRLHCLNESKETITFYYPLHKPNIKQLPLLSIKRFQYPSLAITVETNDHRVFMFGGQLYYQGKYITAANSYEYLERKCRMIERPRMTFPRVKMQSSILLAEIYILGGEDDGKQLTYVESYSLETNEWCPKAEMPNSIQHGIVVTIRRDEIHCLGVISSSQFSISKYIIKENQWNIVDVKLNYAPPTLHNMKLAVNCNNDILLFGNGTVVKYNNVDIGFEKLYDCSALDSLTDICSYCVLGSMIYLMDRFKILKIEGKSGNSELITEYYSQKEKKNAPNSKTNIK